MTRLRRLFLAALLSAGALITPLAQALSPEVPVHQLSEKFWDVSSGLPHSSGKAVLQAASGAVWIGTQNGLARFDGVEFEVFRADRHPGLTDNYIRALFEDESSRLWIATQRGVSFHEGGDIRMPGGEGRATGRVFAIAPGPGPDEVWLATNNGLFLASPDRLEAHSRIREPVFSLAHIEGGRLVVGGRGRIWLLDGNELEVHALPDEEAELVVYTLLIDGKDLVQGLSTGGGLRRAPIEQPTVWTEQLLEDLYVLDLLIDHHGTLWIASNSGLKRRLPGNTGIEAVRTRSLGEIDWVWSLHVDTESNLWIGSQSGVMRLSKSAFRHYGEIDGLPDGPVWVYFEDPVGDIWVGSDDRGAFRLDGDHFEQAILPRDLPHATVNGFLVDRNQRLWVATMRGVAWFSWPEIEPLETPAELAALNVLGLIQAADGRVWLAARPGIYSWREGELERVDSRPRLDQLLANDVMEDRRGRIWVATDNGVFRGDARGLEAVGMELGLMQYTASTLFEFHDEIWVAMGGPLARFVEVEARIYDGHGLGTSLGSFLALDADDHLWLTTHEGIQRVARSQFDQIDRGERENLEMEVFGRLTDPVIAQCTGGQGQAGLYQDGPGVLWCPTMRGALRLDLARAVQAPPPPLPRLRAVRSGGQLHRLDFVEQARLDLPPEARDLEVAFSGLQFRHPEGVQYRYRLHGFDANWQDAERRRSAFYTNLPPGDYRFEVFALNEHGVQSPLPASLDLRFAPRLHERLAFRILMLMVGLLGLYALWRYSVHQLRQRQHVLEQRVQERTRQLDEANRQLRQASLTDPLTGLRNRRYLTEHLPQDVAQVDRAWHDAENPEQQDIVFLIIDLDHFKRINDEYGHRVGDEVLKQIGELLLSLARESDYIVRLGGEEFLIVARQASRSQATVQAERIMASLRRQRYCIDGHEIECSCSIGIACYPALPGRPRALSWEYALELADVAAYLAKEEGRDRWIALELTDSAQLDDFMLRLRDKGVEALAACGEVTLRREKSPA